MSSVTTRLGDTVDFDLRGSGPAVVFVAGAGPYRAIDAETNEAAELAAGLGLTTVVPDRIGRGESPAAGRLTLDRELAAVEALIAAAGGSAWLVGHSSGCAIALAAAVRGLAVDGLVLFEAPLGQGAEPTREWIGEFERLLDAGDDAGALRQYMKDMPPEFLEFVEQQPFHAQLVRQAGSQRPDGEALVWAESAPFAELFGGLRIPVHCLVGEQTFPGMPEAAEALAAAVPGATSGTVAGAFHTWDPKALATLLPRLTA